MKCHTCGDRGIEGGCPKCGLTPRKSSALNALHFDTPTDIIPRAYQGDLWEMPEQENVELRFQKFDKALDTILNKFLHGEVPHYSAFIAAPPKYGKTKFAYSCMQTALTQRFSVAPLMSTSDWRRIYKVSQINPFYKMYGKYKWDDLVAMDVVFLFVDHGDDHNDDIPLLKSILDARAMFDSPTFIISDYRLNDLVPSWNSDVYSIIYNPNSNRDFLRFPVVLHRFE